MVASPEECLRHDLERVRGSLAAAANCGGTVAEQRNFRNRASLAFIEGAKPQGEIESALLLQMACTHAAAMAVLGRLGGGPDRNIALKASAVSRLLRAYTAQLEILRRLRNGGTQVVRVEHVHVNEGGQAIIGNVRSGTAGEGHHFEQDEQ